MALIEVVEFPMMTRVWGAVSLAFVMIADIETAFHDVIGCTVIQRIGMFPRIGRDVITGIVAVWRRCQDRVCCHQDRDTNFPVRNPTHSALARHKVVPSRDTVRNTGGRGIAIRRRAAPVRQNVR